MMSTGARLGTLQSQSTRLEKLLQTAQTRLIEFQKVVRERFLDKEINVDGKINEESIQLESLQENIYKLLQHGFTQTSQSTNKLSAHDDLQEMLVSARRCNEFVSSKKAELSLCRKQIDTARKLYNILVTMVQLDGNSIELHQVEALRRQSSSYRRQLQTLVYT